MKQLVRSKCQPSTENVQAEAFTHYVRRFSRDLLCLDSGSSRLTATKSRLQVCSPQRCSASVSLAAVEIAIREESMSVAEEQEAYPVLRKDQDGVARLT